MISKEGYAFRADCSVKLASGQQLISHGSGGDAHAAFDAALARALAGRGPHLIEAVLG